MKMGESKGKKSRKYRIKRRAHRPSGHGGPRGGSPRRTLPPPNRLRRTYNDKAEPKPAPKEKRSNWNGKVEVWTEPQKPKQEKIIKYEVDTDKLIDEIADENKKTISEIAERLNGEPDSEQSDEAGMQKLDSPDEAEPTEEAEVAEEELDLEISEDEPEQEASSEIKQSDETESIEQVEPEELEVDAEDNLDDPTFTDPSFWERLESEISDELEQIEPEMEAPPEEDCY